MYLYVFLYIHMYTYIELTRGRDAGTRERDKAACVRDEQVLVSL